MVRRSMHESSRGDAFARIIMVYTDAPFLDPDYAFFSRLRREHASGAVSWTGQ